MTINDIMLRDMQDEERRERMLLDLDREMRERHMRSRRAWRKRIRRWLEIIGGILTLALFVLLAWLFLVATPEQYSAECELLRAEMEAQGK